MNAIIAEVARRGRVSFAEFMELALYHPEAGYYTRRRRGPGPVGAAGDFITAPTATPLFARTLAVMLRRLSHAVGDQVTFVELGAGEGLSLRRVVSELGGIGPGALRRVVAVEVADWARERLVAECPGVEARRSLAELPHPSGPVVLFASELYDALPAHRITVRRRGGVLEHVEYFVEPSGGGRLRWALGELSRPELESYLVTHNLVLEEGQVAELRPDAEAVHAGHLAWCGKNAVALVLDYGYPARQLYNPRGRKHGSLVGYRGHSLVSNVLSNPGGVDITAHVNFDDLTNAAAGLGWDRGQMRPLGAFLALHGALDLLPAGAARGEPLSPADWAELATAKKLLAPSGMAVDQKVLEQGKGPAWQAYCKLATPPPVDA